jgi:hypothetical protein
MVSHTFSVIARLAKPAEAISGRGILNPKHQTPNEFKTQRSKIKMTIQNAKIGKAQMPQLRHFVLWILGFGI